MAGFPSRHLVPLAIAGMLGFAMLPLVDVWRAAVYPLTPGRFWHFVIALGTCLAVQTWLVVSLARTAPTTRHRRVGALLAVLNVAALPVVGPDYATHFARTFAVLALLLVRRPWSYLLFLAAVATPYPITILTGHDGWGDEFGYRAATYGLALSVLVWLVRALRELSAARVRLADEAVIRERLRIDRELSATLGQELARIAGAIQRADEQLGSDQRQAADSVRALVARSRRVLAETRRLVTRYQARSLRGELDSALALLAAAGITTRVLGPVDAIGGAASDAHRTALRVRVAALLRDESTRTAVLRISGHGADVHLELRAEQPAGDRLG